MFAITAKTISETHSWITFNCMSEKGPPSPWKPIRLAGTWQQYSKKAMHHEKTMTPISGQWLLMCACCSFRWPYQANVIKTLLHSSNAMVDNPRYTVFTVYLLFVALLASLMTESTTYHAMIMAKAYSWKMISSGTQVMRKE